MLTKEQNAKGGKVTAKRYGREYMSMLAKKSWIGRRSKKRKKTGSKRVD